MAANRMTGDVDDGAAAGKVGDDFVLLGARGSAGRENSQKNQGGANEEVLHGGRVAQRADSRLGAVRGMVPEWRGIR